MSLMYDLDMRTCPIFFSPINVTNQRQHTRAIVFQRTDVHIHLYQMTRICLHS